ncbi:MAG: HAD family hydrolase [Candidatus Scalindua sp.]|nr:HAD family hydrolase [Candidatus Scalindua sp.]
MTDAVFLDRDGTINKDTGYVHKPEDLLILPGVIKGLQLLSYCKLFIITNQSGIGRGYFTKEEFFTFNNLLVKNLNDNNITIIETYYCPHKPDAGCDCRKPRIKHLKDAEKKYKIDLSRSYVIGDQASDIEMGRKGGCKTMLVLTGHGEKHHKNFTLKPDIIVNNLYEGAEFIANER